jgi:hypothetical protein
MISEPNRHDRWRELWLHDVFHAYEYAQSGNAPAESPVCSFGYPVNTGLLHSRFLSRRLSKISNKPKIPPRKTGFIDKQFPWFYLLLPLLLRVEQTPEAITRI